MSSPQIVDRVQIALRNAINPHDELLTISSQWTVAQLKKHISLVHSALPCPTTQRLIYMGHMMLDTERISDVFCRSGQPLEAEQIYVVHFMYTTKNATPELRQRRVPQTPQSSCNVAPSPTQFISTPVINAPTIPIAQMQSSSPANVLQQYNMAMMAQYQALMAMNNMHNNNQMNLYQMQMANMNAMMMGQVPTEMAGQSQPVVDQVPNAAADVPAANANGAGGAVAAEEAENDEMMPRDWLDYVYLALRAAMLLIVLFFYSSTQRIFGVIIAALAMWAFGRRRAAPPQAPAPQGPQPNVAANAAPSEPGTPAAENVPLIPPVETPEPAAWKVFWSTCYAFISGFFLSLVPENIHQLEEAQRIAIIRQQNELAMQQQQQQQQQNNQPNNNVNPNNNNNQQEQPPVEG